MSERARDKSPEANLQDVGQAGEKCPFEFNFDPVTFKPGDLVSYRIPGRLGDMPLVGALLAVFEEHVEISPNDPTEITQIGHRLLKFWTRIAEIDSPKAPQPQQLLLYARLSGNRTLAADETSGQGVA